MAPVGAGPAPEAEKPVEPLELFFDLVFVFAITQVTARLASRRRAGSGGGCWCWPRSVGRGAPRRG